MGYNVFGMGGQAQQVCFLRRDIHVHDPCPLELKNVGQIIVNRCHDPGCVRTGRANEEYRWYDRCQGVFSGAQASARGTRKVQS